MSQPNVKDMGDMDTLNTGQRSMNHVQDEEELRNALSKSVTLSPELFERLYLSPKNEVAGDLRKTFANPTPMAVMGFSVGVFPLSIALMGWGGSGNFATATTSCSIFFGGMLLIIAGLLEFVLGNNFPFLVFMGYGAHFLSFACTFLPSFDAIAFASGGDPYEVTAKFQASFVYYTTALAILSFIFLLGSLRTNLIFVLIFISALSGFCFASAGLYYLSKGEMAKGNQFVVATGAGFFAADMLGFYLFLGMMFEIMELPFPTPPVWDLSTVVKPKKKKTM